MSNPPTLSVSRLLIFNENPTLTTALRVNSLCQGGTTQPTTRVGCPDSCGALPGVPRRRKGFLFYLLCVFVLLFFLIGGERLAWAYKRVQLGMDFSSLLLVVKGEWSHTGMDEILLCVMKWGWRNRAGKPPPEPSIPLKAWSLLSFTVGAGDGGAEGWQYYEQGSAQRMGHSYPKIFFPRPPLMPGLNCRAEKSLQLWFFSNKMEIAHNGHHEPHMGT